MKLPNIQKQVLQKRIPTLLGLGVLVIALVAGTFLLSEGPGVFTPRATPETTPKKIKVSNITENSFTVSFVTDEATAGFVKYGESPGSLNEQSSDDRDQLSGSVGQYKTHHVSVRGLEENTTYHYVLGTGDGATFDNNGSPFSVTTARRNGVPSEAKTIYGTVTTPSGGPAEGAMVYVNFQGAGQMSSLVKGSGSFAIPLSNARTQDGTNYATVTDSTQLTISVQGPAPAQEGTFNQPVSNAQPIPAISLSSTGAQMADAGSGQAATPSPTPTMAPSPSPSPDTTVETETAEADTAETESATDSAGTSSRRGQLSGLLEDEGLASESAQSDTDEAMMEENTVVDLNDTENEQTVTTSKPKFVGKLPPQTMINVEVNSETQITQEVVTDADGNFELDLNELEQELEPGEHTVTYTYIDPDTGEEVSETITFTVSDTSNQLAQATTENDEPYGSGNPYPAGASPTPSPTPSVSPSPSPSVSPSPTATSSASPSPSADTTATDSGRTSMPSTDSAIPESGSVGTTFALVFGGLFFIISGVWSYWISRQLARDEVV